MAKLELIATAAFGLESLVAFELKKLGYEDVKIDNGRIFFSGDELAICRANLWLRCADRVLVKMGQFTATTFDELFDNTKALPWHEWLSKDASFPVTGKSVKSGLSSVPACQSIVKKAIAASLSEHYGISWFEETGPVYKVQVSILKDVVTLTIDTSGDGLHKRGYRELTADAPLKETLAAGLIYLSNWNPERQLIDPFCGSGTIPIEAALMGLNIAPGIKRTFAAEGWPLISKKYWEMARKEADELINREAKFRVLGYDIDKKVLKLARYHAQKAGVENYTDFHPGAVEDLKSARKYGYIICNPPYGERLSNKREIINLYRSMGKTFSELGDGTWSFYILTSMDNFEKYFGTLANKKRKLFNGKIKVNYYQYYGPTPLKQQGQN